MDQNLDNLSLEDLQALRTQAIKDKVTAAATKYGVDPAYSHAIVGIESKYNPDAISPAGAISVMQLMPETAKGLNVDPYNVDQNIDGGHKLLKDLLDRYKDPYVAAIAYNARPAVADKFLKSGNLDDLPLETLNYLKKLKEIYQPGQGQGQDDDFKISPDPFESFNTADNVDQAQIQVPKESSILYEKLGAAGAGVGARLGADYLSSTPITPEVKQAQDALDKLAAKTAQEDFIAQKIAQEVGDVTPQLSGDLRAQHVLDLNALKEKHAKELFELNNKYNYPPKLASDSAPRNFFTANDGDLANQLMQGKQGQGLQNSVGFGDARKLAENKYRYGLADAIDYASSGKLPPSAVRDFELNFGLGNLVRTPELIAVPKTAINQQTIDQLNASTPEAIRQSEINQIKQKVMTDKQLLKLKHNQELANLRSNHITDVTNIQRNKNATKEAIDIASKNAAAEWAANNLSKAQEASLPRYKAIGQNIGRVGNSAGKFLAPVGGALDVLETRNDFANKDYARAALSGTSAGLGALSLLPRLAGLSNPIGLGILAIQGAKYAYDNPKLFVGGDNPQRYTQKITDAQRAQVMRAQPMIAGLEYLIDR